MAERMVNHFYQTYVEAVQAVADLVAYGVPATDIDIIESEDDARLPQAVMRGSSQNPAGTGATLGAAVGAGLGALVGVGAVTIPYADPLFAAGWFVCCLTFAGIGASAGLLLGAIARLRVRRDPAHAIAVRLQAGEHLVMARVDEHAVPQVAEVLARRHTVPGGRDAVEPTYDMEPVIDDRTPAEEAAAIHRREQTLQYKSE